MSGIGHNSEDVLNQTAQSQLRSTIERWERLLQERQEISELIKELKAEAKGQGFDVTIMGKVIKIRAMDRARRLEKAAVLGLYMHAVGEEPDGEFDEFA